MLVLQKDGKTPVYRLLYNVLKEQIICGEKKPGEKLPSKREMAEQLGLSVNTVDNAYSQLTSEGFLQSRARSGYYVCAIDKVQAVRLSAMQEPGIVPEKKWLVDFDPGGTAQQLFPLTVWQRLAKEVLSTRNWLKRCPRQGDPGLRQAVAAYLRSSRNVSCTAEQVVIGSGTESLMTMLGLLLERSVSFAVENPVYNKSADLLLRMGHPLTPVPVDRQGVMLEPLASLTDTVLYTTPSHQYPLGICMPMARRIKLLNWCAAAEQRFILEDDYDSEFRYDARPVPSLQSIDPNGRILYLGTFSATVSPAIRVAYLVLPAQLLTAYRKCGNFSCGVPQLEQMILREFMEQGYFEKHLNRMRTYYRKQRELLLTELSVFGEEIRVIGEAAGCHLTVKVCNGMKEAELCAAAAEVGVRVYPISECFLTKMPEKFQSKVLLGFGGLSGEEIIRGVSLLYRAWHRKIE